MSEETAELIVDLDRPGVTYYAAAHENVAVGMADGYAWATDDVGIAIIGRGQVSPTQ
jgi:thiamine pyrophosphate-dependent acetolactate synthase large subunit-like protein